MSKFVHPYYPIIYVRGYAMHMGEVEDTVATPFMGFNLGSTKLRQTWGGDMEKHIFESPLVRLMKDVKYRDVYREGEFESFNFRQEVAERGADPEEIRIPALSVVIFRYYDDVSKSFGGNMHLEITRYARDLSKLIDDLKQAICESDEDERDFRVYLVAHSMGGLICRCLLQNPQVDEFRTARRVDKVFTYATPHNGIDYRVVGNVGGFLGGGIGGAKNIKLDYFNRKEMAEYLAFPSAARDRADKDGANLLNGTFPPERFFCLVGTNPKDYTVARGASSFLAGPLSDGLVRINNAWVKDAPRAFAHRSHSGDYGIVNSEEGYNNLIRFLFGRWRVDGTLTFEDIELPTAVTNLLAKKKLPSEKVKASYHIETVVRVRGKRWDLHRRTTDCNSAIFKKYDDLLARGDVRTKSRPVLFTVYLSDNSKWARVSKDPEDGIAFSLELRVLVPDYVVDGFAFLDHHFEGSHLFNDTLIFRIVGGEDEKVLPRIFYSFQSNQKKQSEQEAVLRRDGESLSFDIVLDTLAERDPGMKATLTITAGKWNREPRA